MRLIHPTYCSLLLLLVCISCSRQPGNVLSREEMIEVMYDMELAKAVLNSRSSYNEVEKKDAVIQGVFSKYDIVEATFDTSLVWYSDNPQLLDQIMDSVRVRLKDKANYINALNSEELRKKGMHVLPEYFYLSEDNTTKAFNIDSLKLRSIGLKKCYFSFDVQGLSSHADIDMSVLYQFRDTQIVRSRTIMNNNYNTILQPTVDKDSLIGISGYFRLNKGEYNVPVSVYNILCADSLPQHRSR